MRGHHGRRFGRGRHGKPLMFGTTKVGERGQIVIPKEAREKFGIQPGDSLFVIGDEEKQGLAIVKTDLLEGFALQILQGIGYFNNEGSQENMDETEERGGIQEEDVSEGRADATESDNSAGEDDRKADDHGDK